MMNKIIKKNKYIENRKATPKEILYIFEKLLENNQIFKFERESL